MRLPALITFPLILTPHLEAAVTVQTVTLEAPEIIASGTSSGDSDETIQVSFPEFEFVFDQFDPALGTLDQVTFELLYSYGSSTTSSSLTSAVAGFETESRLGSPVNTAVNGIDLIGTGAGTGQLSTTPNEVVDLGITIALTGRPISGQVEAMGLEGLGSASFQVQPSDRFEANFSVFGYFTDYSIQRDAGAALTVTYEFTPIPEPSTAGLIFGLLPLGLATSRRRPCP